MKKNEEPITYCEKEDVLCFQKIDLKTYERIKDGCRARVCVRKRKNNE